MYDQGGTVVVHEVRHELRYEMRRQVEDESSKKHYRKINWGVSIKEDIGEEAIDLMK